MTAAASMRGTLLGGRVAYAQPEAGHRTGIEPVLLAASVPASGGEHVLEGGTGAGAGMLCLLARVETVRVTGLEASAALVALARDNLLANGFARRGEVTATVLPALPPGLGTVSHVFANPPWFDPSGTVPDDPARRLARTLPPGGLAVWADALGRRVVPGGTFGLIVPAALHGSARQALRDAGFGAILLVPLWPRQGRDAKIAIVRGRKGARGPDRIAAGLVLHEADGRFTAAADAILRDGEAFPSL